jgi:uncharacterized protein YccT (UPF0319 family)
MLTIETLTKPQIKSSVPANFIENMEYFCKIVGSKIDVKIIKSKKTQKEYSICSIRVSYEGKPFDATILADVTEYAKFISVGDVVTVGCNIEGCYKNAFIVDNNTFKRDAEELEIENPEIELTPEQSKLKTFAGGIEYLNKKGSDISLISDELLNSKEPKIRIINEENSQYNQSDEDIGKQGELVVFEKLKQIYTKKYSQNISETATGFKVGNNVEVFWLNIIHPTTADHDFKVVELNKIIYIDSKATIYDKNVEKVALYISGNELELMERADKYLMARVYNATSKNPIVEFVRMQIDYLED